MNESQRGAVEVHEFGTAGFVAREFHHVAVREKFAENFFLLGIQQRGGAKFGDEFLGGAFGRAEVEAFLKVLAERVGDCDAEGLGLV